MPVKKKSTEFNLGVMIMTRVTGWGYVTWLKEHQPEVTFGEYNAIKEAQEYKELYQNKLAKAEKEKDGLEYLNKDLYKEQILKADLVLDKRHWEYTKSCNRAGIEPLEKDDFIAAVLLED